MKPRSICILVGILLMTLSVGSLGAGGGGGSFFGQTLPGQGELSSNEAWFDQEPLLYRGGEGFGISSDGEISGGFGIGISGGTGGDEIQGGFGGLVFGKEVSFGRLFIANRNRLGIGSLTLGARQGEALPANLAGFATSPLSLLGQVELEAGLTLLPWFRISVNGGMAGVLGFPDEADLEAWLHTPYYGFRFMFGGFDL